MQTLFLLCLIVATFVIGYTVGTDQHNGYLDCWEDEVWTYAGNFPDNVVWLCVPKDNLE